MRSSAPNAFSTVWRLATRHRVGSLPFGACPELAPDTPPTHPTERKYAYVIAAHTVRGRPKDMRESPKNRAESLRRTALDLPPHHGKTCFAWPHHSAGPPCAYTAKIMYI